MGIDQWRNGGSNGVLRPIFEHEFQNDQKMCTICSGMQMTTYLSTNPAAGAKVSKNSGRSGPGKAEHDGQKRAQFAIGG
jgi:hypothetical protein